MIAQPSRSLTKSIWRSGDGPLGSGRSCHVSPRSPERKRAWPATRPHTTSVVGALSWTDVGIGMGERDGVAVEVRVVDGAAVLARAVAVALAGGVAVGAGEATAAGVPGRVTIRTTTIAVAVRKAPSASARSLLIAPSLLRKSSAGWRRGRRRPPWPSRSRRAAAYS